MKDFYEILGVSPNSETEVITAAYKALMRKYHPDTNRSAEAAAKAQEINEAYEVLKSPLRRREYDAKRGLNSSAPPLPPLSEPNASTSEASGRRQDGRRRPLIALAGIILVLAVGGFFVSASFSTSDQAEEGAVVEHVATGDKAAGDAAFGVGDYETASREYRLLAEQGDAGAQNVLGHMYQEGLGVPKNYNEAVRLYRLAAEQSHAGAQLLLGEMYVMGRGVPQDYGEAVRLYRLSADQGNALAQANLGAMYANGNGVPRSDVRAYMWLNLAAAQLDFPDILTNRDSISERMSSQDISRAQQLTQECLARNYRGC